MRLRTLIATTFASLLAFASATSVALGLMLLAGPSQACWAGVHVETAQVTVTTRSVESRWSPDLARETGLWIARIEALLPADVHLTVQQGVIEICGAHGNEDFGCIEPDAQWEDGTWPSLFNLVATATDVSPTARGAARKLSAKPKTIQLGAFKSATAAQRFAATVSAKLSRSPIDADLFGFVEIGSFPASNPIVHVIAPISAAKRPTYRVIIGSYLDAAEARLAAAQIKAATRLNTIVRPL